MGNIVTIAQHAIVIHTHTHTHTQSHIEYVQTISSVHHHSFVPTVWEWVGDIEWIKWNEEEEEETNHNGKLSYERPFVTQQSSLHLSLISHLFKLVQLHYTFYSSLYVLLDYYSPHTYFRSIFSRTNSFYTAHTNTHTHFDFHFRNLSFDLLMSLMRILLYNRNTYLLLQRYSLKKAYVLSLFYSSWYSKRMWV